MSYASCCSVVVCLCVDCFCLVCLCVSFVSNCVAWSAVVCVGACICVCDVVCVVRVAFGEANVFCFVLSVIYGVRCCVVCDYLCVLCVNSVVV